MSFLSGLRTWLQPSKRKRSRRGPCARQRLHVEQLETRDLPSTFSVLLTKSATMIPENGSLNLSVSVTDPAGSQDAHNVVISWGDGQNLPLNLPAGLLAFSTVHKYLDNPAAPNVSFPINVSVSDGARQASASTSIQVSNVAPSNLTLSQSSSSIAENSTLTLGGSFADPGTLDSHTVSIVWGDGQSSTVSLAPGVLTFSTSHRFLDNPANQPSGSYPISVTVADKDGGQTSAATSIQVTNVAPSNLTLDLSASTITKGGSPTLTGTFSDPGTLDTHSAVISWGDGGSSTVNLAAGILTFSTSHQYVSQGTFAISANVTDKDGGQTSAGTSIQVNNPGTNVIVSDAGGTYTGSPFSASATATDQGVTLSGTFAFTYYNGSLPSGTGSSTAPTHVGTYTVVASFTSANPSYQNAVSGPLTFIITKAAPAVTVSDNGSSYNGLVRAAGATVAGVAPGVDTTPAASLEGVTPTLTYYAGATPTGTALSGAPVQAGTYTVVASFGGSADYASATASTTFTIARATPTVSVGDAGGTFHGSAFPATATVAGAVAGVDSTPAASLEGVTPTLTYYAGSSATGTPLAGAPTHPGTYTVVASFAGSADYTSASATTTFSIAHATPAVGVSDAGGTYHGAPFPATATVAGVVAGVDTSPASSLQGVTPTLTYYAGASGTALAGAPAHAGTYTVVASFAGSADYSSASTTITFGIARATPAVSVSDAGGTFHGAAFPATATVAGVVVGVDNTPAASLEGVTPTLTYYAGASASGTALAGAPTHPGTYTVVASFAGSADFASGSATTTFSITRAAPALSISDAGGTFHGVAFPATATVAGVMVGVDTSPAASLQGVTPTLTYYAGASASGTALAGAPAHAGTYTVFASFAGSADYASSSATITFNIAHATPTMTVSDAGGGFTGAASPATATVAGVVAGVDTSPAASLQGVTPTLTYYAGASASGTALAGAPSHAGTYTVVASFAGSADYAGASATATFTIARATPTVSVSDAGGTFTGSAFSALATVAGVVQGVDRSPAASLEGVAPTLAYYTGPTPTGTALATIPTHPGTYTVLASFAGSTDYVSGSASVTFTIARALPTLSVSAAGGTYSGAPFGATVTVAGLVTGVDTTPAASLQGVTPTLTYYAGTTTTGAALAGAPSLAGHYTVVASFAGSSDYSGTTSTIGFTIAAALPVVSVNDAGGVYNGSTFPASAMVAGVVAGVDDMLAPALEGVTPTLAYYAGTSASGAALPGAPTQAGTYTVVASFPGSSDYKSASATTSFTIARATPTVSVTDGGGVFDGSTFPASATVTGVVPGLDNSPAASLEGIAPTFTYFAGSGITGAALPGAPSQPGIYAVLASFAGGTDYTSASASTTFQISSKPLPLVTVMDPGGTYDGAAYSASAMATDPNGFAVFGSFTFIYYNGSAPNGVGLTTAPIHPGTYTVVAVFTSGDPGYDNAQSSPMTFVITPAGPTVTVTDTSDTYSGSPFTAVATVAGVVPGLDTTAATSLEGITTTLTYYAGAAASGSSISAPVHPGAYTVVAAFAGSTDYLAASVSSSFTISQASPNVSVSDGGETFNGSAFAATAAVRGVVVGVDDTPAAGLEGVAVTLTYYAGALASGTPLPAAPTQAGTYSVSASYAGSQDYTNGNASVTFTIARATPTVSVTDAGGTFKGSGFPATATVAGVVPGLDNTPAGGLDGVTLTLTYYAGSSAGGTPLPGAPSQAGTYTVVASYAGSTDYLPRNASTTFTIARATPTVSVGDAGGTFNGSAFPAIAKVAGVVAGLDQAPAASLEGVTPSLTYYTGSSASGTALASAPVQPGTYTVVALFAGSTDYTSASATASFTIQANSVQVPTVTALDTNGVYNGSAFTATATATGLGAIAVAGTFTFSYYNGSTVSGQGSSTAPSHAGTYTVVAFFTSSNPQYGNAQSAPVTFNITRATPTVNVSAGGTFNGAAFPATATVAGVVTGVDRTPAASLEGITPTLTYYAGSSATGTPLAGAPSHAGTYTVKASFAGSTDYLSGTAITTFTIARATPTVSVSDAAGTFNGAAFTATATVAGVVTGVDRTPAASLEGVTPTLTYYAGSSATGTPLGAAPTHPGTYTVAASFAASTDYLSGTATTTFVIARATPAVSVSDAAGTFNGAVFTATATVAGVVTGVDRTPAASLEGVTPSLTYYAGSSATGTPLAGAPSHAGTYTVKASFAGSTDYLSGTATTTFTIARATPTVSVSAAAGPFTGAAFTATATVAGVVTGVDRTPAASLQGVALTLAYYAGSTTSGTALAGAPTQTGTYTVLASFAGSSDYASANAHATFSITSGVLSASLGNNGPIVQGNAVTVSFTNPSDSSTADTQAGFHYSFALSASGLASSYAAAGASTSAQFIFANSGSYTVYGCIFAEDGGLTSYTTTVTVNAVNVVNAPMLHFDFGTSGSPVAAGYTKVTQATHYSPSLGYGWLSGNIQSTDTGSGSSLDRAFNYTPDGVFEYDVPNGTYLVALTIGDAAAAVQGMYVWLPASQKLDPVPSAAAGQLTTRNYAVTVNNHQLLVEISDPLAPTNYAVINGLDVSLVTLTPPTATFSNNGPINGGSSATVSFSNQAAGTGTYTYSYDFANNGTFEIANSTSASTVVPASYLSTAGQHVVHGRITDTAGGFNDYTTTINVTTPPATPPVLTSPASLTATQGVSANFGLGSFSDPGANDSPWSVTVNWGDSTSPSTFTATAQGALHPAHTYATSGNFIATLTVTNSANASAAANIPITVAPPGPPSDYTAPYIVTPFDQIPNFGAHPSVHNTQSGAWSSPGTWSTGVVPTTGDIVSIEPGTTVTYDVVSTAAVNTVIIQNTGSLVFRTDTNTELTVVNLLVLQGGTLQVGTQANPVAASVKAQIVFPDQPLNTTLDPAQYGNGLIALGTVTMCGAAMNQTFVTLATEPHAGDSTLTLSQAVTGWNVGDHLILPDTRQLTANNSLPLGTYTPEYEQLTIASISANGTVITLSSPLQFDHLGARNEAGVLEYLPQVMDLTRNVILRSANPSGTRGQTMFTYRATVDIRYVEFAGLGRTQINPQDNTTFDANGNVTHVGTNEEDRNPIQFRDLFGPATVPADGYQYTFVGNSVFCPLTPMTFIWGININNSDYGLIQENVLYNWAGAGLVTETGSESYNMIADNMVVRVTGTGQRMDFGRDGIGFWFGGPNNYVVNNVASDISGTLNIYSYGFNLFFEAQYMAGGTVLTIPAYQGADPTISGQSATLNINTSPLLAFSGNETYGAIANGLAFWSLGERDGISIPGGQAGTIENFVVWHQWNYGVFAYYSQNLTIDHFVDLGDPSMIGGAGTGMLFGDYAEKNLVVTNADVEGQVYGITAGVAANGTSQTYENSYLDNIYDVWVQPLTTSAYRADLIAPVTIVLSNDKFATPATTLPTAAIEMHMFPLSQLPGLVVNLTALQQILVYDYNQVSGDDFQVYYAWQLPNYVMPQSIFNSDGTPQVLGAPAANVTNAHAWAVYGIAMEGAVAPANSKTRSGIDGLVDPIPPA